VPLLPGVVLQMASDQPDPGKLMLDPTVRSKAGVNFLDEARNRAPGGCVRAVGRFYPILTATTCPPETVAITRFESSLAAIGRSSVTNSPPAPST
jgi:hypothetical protein